MSWQRLTWHWMTTKAVSHTHRLTAIGSRKKRETKSKVIPVIRNPNVYLSSVAVIYKVIYFMKLQIGKQNAGFHREISSFVANEAWSFKFDREIRFLVNARYIQLFIPIGSVMFDETLQSIESIRIDYCRRLFAIYFLGFFSFGSNFAERCSAL